MAAPSISAADWALAQKIGKEHGVDPRILVAIGMHETGWGTLGDGRNGNILGYGSFDSGSSYQWAGLQNQLEGAAGLLAGWGVHTIADVAAGKASHYATDPNWSAGVVASYNSLGGKKFTGKVSTASASAPQGAQVGAASGSAAGVTPAKPAHYDASTLAEQFGYQAAFFNTDPSLKHWMQAALNGKFGDLNTSIGSNRATAALHATKWFQTHTTAQAQWQNLLTSHPADAKQQIAQKTQDVLNLAHSEGVTLDANTASQIAKAALSNGLDDSHLKLAVDSHAAYHAGVAFGGQLGQIKDQFSQLASQYGVDMSDQALSQWAVNTLQGKQTDQDFLNLVKQQASTKYPGMAPSIASGVTPEQYADQYKQTYANLLEVDPSSIDWKKDPLIQQALQYQPGTDPSSKGQAPGAMPLWQFEQQVKKDPRWDYTDNAKQSILTSIAGVGRDFGFV